MSPGAPLPIAIFNFVEGTRFSVAKRDAQQSPYRHLLRPKAGGIAQVLSLLGNQLDGILDVTISYANPSPTFWGFLCGREAPVTLQIRQLSIPEWMYASDNHEEKQHKERFHTWINALWLEKMACWTAEPITTSWLAHCLAVSGATHRLLQRSSIIPASGCA
ncbi:hypothetical protein HORIV_37360 [Vreelandella olivaria]|uniref:Uncharacterized protein n=1 Tax=Vreelandella olivaria TaxID=390919 RepID=A0ABN5WY30_9GAMM|nr:hypothetical protein HORIV_37360 [Halomonas olivaria]